MKSSKCRACSWRFCWRAQLQVTLPTKKFSQTLNFILELLNTAAIRHHAWVDRRQLCKKKYFHGEDVKVVSLFSLINERITFFVITEEELEWAIASIKGSKCHNFFMAIFLVYSIPGITSDENLVATSCGGHLENVKISNTDSIWHQKWKHYPKLCKKNMVMTSSIYLQGDLKVVTLYSLWMQK